MKPISRVLLMLLFLLTPTLIVDSPASAASPSFVVVNYGDTLYSIAARHFVSVDALVRANGLPSASFIWAGQRLIIPASSPAPAPKPESRPSVYTVSPGDTLYSIATRYGTTVNAVMRANNLYNPSFIYAGQRLNIPGNTPPAPVAPGAPVKLPAGNEHAPAPTNGKWIDVDISAQRITAFQGNTPVKSVLVSTGVSWHPTPIGHYKVYLKVASQTMSGGSGADAYRLPNVPWIMYFSGGNAIHGTYWHHNFGTPMSHGCVNLTIEDAKWFYDWAPMGTPVVTHV